MTYDFFAGEKDKIALLTYVFENTDLQVFDLYSYYGTEITEYRTVADIVSRFNLKSDSIYLQLWSPQFKGKIDFRSVELDPKRCKGHTFRYATGGWGLFSSIYME